MTALGPVLSLLVFASLLLPPGYALLRLAGSRGAGLPGLAAAMGLGWSVVLPLVLAEIRLGVSGLAVGLALAGLAWLRPGRAAVREAKLLAPDLALPLALGALAWIANVGDLRREPAGISLRLGFEVADRLTYSLVADELLRATPLQLENPLFAPVPLQYSVLPSLAALLLRRSTGLDSLDVALTCLPAVGMVFVGLATAGLLAQWGATRTRRVLTTLLIVLGGDLSFLTVTRDRTGLERATHFFSFHSFSAEALLYNPWVFGLPLALTALLLAQRWLGGGQRAELALVALVLGALWPTKAFAFLALLAGACLAATLRRNARLAALVLAGLVGAGPWLLLTALSPGGRGGGPLTPEPLHPVRLSMEFNETLSSAAALAGEGWPRLALGTLLFLCGGFGLRLLGLPAFLRSTRSDASGLQAFVALTVATCVTASLTLKGQPMAVDAVQFLLFGQYLLWLPAGAVLAELFARRASLALLLLGLATVSPLLYLGRKLAPERLTAPGALDRASLRLGPATVEACAWAREHTPAQDRLVLPLSADPEDVGGVKPLLVAALSGRRVSAYTVPLSVAGEVLRQRRQWADRVYDATETAEVEAALDRLGAQWVWADARRPPAAPLPSFERLQAAPGIWLLRRPQLSLARPGRPRARPPSKARRARTRRARPCERLPPSPGR